MLLLNKSKFHYFYYSHKNDRLPSEKTEIHKKEALPSHPKSDDDPMSCISIPVGIAIATSAIVNSMSGTAAELEQFICNATLIGFVIMMFLGIRDWFKEIDARTEERKRWAKGCGEVCNHCP